MLAATAFGRAASREFGSRATLRIADHRRTHVDWLTPGSSSHDWVDDFLERHAQAYLLEMEAFARAIRDDLAPTVTGEDAIAAFVLAHACTVSLREQRRVRLDTRNSRFGVEYAIVEDGERV